MCSRPLLALSGFFAACLALPRPAAADPLTAEALFREGRRLLDEGRIDEACTKLAESQTQDPASGTLINLALCYERQGKLATAWATYLAAAASARRDGRADRVLSAEQKGSELEPRVPRLVFRAAQSVPGMVIAWGATRVGSGALGSAIPVDPGNYRIEVSARGYATWTEAVSLRAGESKVVDIPTLQAESIRSEPPTPQALPSAQNASPAQLSRPTPTSEPPSKAESSWVLPVSLGASGIVTLGAGSFFGFRSLSEYADAERACPTHRNCDRGAMDSWQSAKTSAWLANVGVPLGVALTAVSGWLFFSRAASHPRVGMAVTPGARRASIELELEL